MPLMLRVPVAEMSLPREDQATVHVENPKLDVLFFNRKRDIYLTRLSCFVLAGQEFAKHVLVL